MRLLGMITDGLAAMGAARWALLLGVAALAMWLLPRLAEGMERDKVRRIVKGSWVGDHDQRSHAERQASELAGDDARALFLLAQEAVRSGRPALARETMDKLRARVLTPNEARALRALEDAVEGPLPPLAMEAAMRIERMLEAGAHEKARELYARALRRWPDDSELIALQARVAGGDSTVS